MKIVVQRVKDANLSVDGKVVSEIGKGIVAYVCFTESDSGKKELFDWATTKLINLRIFEDENGKTNLSANDVKGEFLLVSQFTLAGDASHGNRPSFIAAMKWGEAKAMFDEFGEKFKNAYGYKTAFGVFGADMTICQTNDGPFTLILEKTL